MQSLLQSLTSSSNRKDVIQIVADSFPTAGPFYVGWREFTIITAQELRSLLNIDSYLLHSLPCRNRAFPGYVSCFDFTTTMLTRYVFSRST